MNVASIARFFGRTAKLPLSRLSASKPNLIRLLNQSIYRQYCEQSSETDSDSDSMDLSNVVKKLHKLANPSLAGSWDNVGLLVEPSAPHQVEKILLTNDLTPGVLQEAIKEKANMVISYHPPIFSSMKRLSQRQWKEKIIIQCLENRIAMFSPHTSYDCVEGGVNDWLIGCYPCGEVQPVEQHMEGAGCYTHSVKFTSPAEQSETLQAALKPVQNIVVRENYNRSETKTCFTIHCNMSSLVQLMKAIQDSVAASQLEVTELSKVPRLGFGMGRKSKLTTPLTVEDAVTTVKQHLGLEHVRLAKPPGMKKISSVAVCAGSGSSVLRNIAVDLYVTGEMSHHDVLHAVCSGTAVILCDHSNTERGYLSVVKSKLEQSLNKETEVVISKVDADPLKIV